MDQCVFFCDLLGFAEISKESKAAVDTLSDVWAVITTQIPKGAGWGSAWDWDRYYGLGDSLFCVCADPVKGLRMASEFFFTLINYREEPAPILVRGAVSFGEVTPVKIQGFLSSQDLCIENLVGPAVAEAAVLEKASGLKGPRLLLSEEFAGTIRAKDPTVANWLLRPTCAPGIWEVVWILPPDPEGVNQDSGHIMSLCRLALKLLETHGGNRQSGEHYREFLLLTARARERARLLGVKTVPAPEEWLEVEQVRATLEVTSGIPEEFINTLMRILDSKAQGSGED